MNLSYKLHSDRIIKRTMDEDDEGLNPRLRKSFLYSSTIENG